MTGIRAFQSKLKLKTLVFREFRSLGRATSWFCAILYKVTGIAQQRVGFGRPVAGNDQLGTELKQKHVSVANGIFPALDSVMASLSRTRY